MRIAEVYSHLNGREHILVHHPSMWPEIEDVVSQVDAEACRTKVSGERGRQGRLLYSPVGLNEEYKRHLTERGWKESRTSYWVTGDQALIRKTIHLPVGEQKAAIEASGRQPIASFNQTDFVKDGVAIEVQFGNTPSLPSTCS
jgi:hypothetical protein